MTHQCTAKGIRYDSMGVNSFTCVWVPCTGCRVNLHSENISYKEGLDSFGKTVFNHSLHVLQQKGSVVTVPALNRHACSLNRLPTFGNKSIWPGL